MLLASNDAEGKLSSCSLYLLFADLCKFSFWSHMPIFYQESLTLPLEAKLRSSSNSVLGSVYQGLSTLLETL